MNLWSKVKICQNPLWLTVTCETEAESIHHTGPFWCKSVTQLRSANDNSKHKVDKSDKHSRSMIDNVMNITDLSCKSSWVIESTVFSGSSIVKSFDHWNINLFLSFCCLSALTTILDCAYPALPGGFSKGLLGMLSPDYTGYHWQVWVRPAICHPLSPGCNEDVTRWSFSLKQHPGPSMAFICFYVWPQKGRQCQNRIALCIEAQSSDSDDISRYFHTFSLKSWGVDYDKMLDFVTRPRCTSQVAVGCSKRLKRFSNDSTASLLILLISD